MECGTSTTSTLIFSSIGLTLIQLKQLQKPLKNILGRFSCTPTATRTRVFASGGQRSIL